MKKLKAILLIVCLGSICTNAFAQYDNGYGPTPRQRNERGNEKKDEGQTRPSGYFEVSIGLAAPMGNFGSTGVMAPYGNYAMPGANIDVSLGIPVAHTNLGVALMYGSYNNPFDAGSFVNYVQLSDQSKTYQALNNDSYNESFILAGLFWTWPVQRLSFDARLMGGIAICYLPEIDYGASVWDPTWSGYDNYEWDYYSSSSTAFAFDIGGDIRYKFRRSSLMFGIDYTVTDPTVNTTMQYTDPNGNYSYSHVGNGTAISVLTFNLGLAYQLNVK